MSCQNKSHRARGTAHNVNMPWAALYPVRGVSRIGLSLRLQKVVPLVLLCARCVPLQLIALSLAIVPSSLTPASTLYSFNLQGILF